MSKNENKIRPEYRSSPQEIAAYKHNIRTYVTGMFSEDPSGRGPDVPGKHAGESSSERYQRHTRNFVAAILVIVAVVVALGIAGASLAVGGW